ncbi:MAG: hypothetical protein V2I37_01730 [Marinilabiliaceae bacterium]|jgi:hypothetical protein|nr:hypothetical protein [Marinilabiliaceae bacterium]
MKRIVNYLLILGFIFMIPSCDEEDLLLINIVHPDGSVLRRIIMTWDKPDFNIAESKVPLDSTWAISDTNYIAGLKDTVYQLIAEKHFDRVEAINESYNNDNGPNRLVERWASFDRNFKWFTTSYRYSENTGGAIEGYLPGEFLSEDELNIFYMPEKIAQDFKSGPDSVLYRQRFDELEEKKEEWLGRSLVKAAFLEIEELKKGDPESDLDMEMLWEGEEEFARILFDEDSLGLVVDSVYGKGFMEKNRVLIDSAIEVLEAKLEIAFNCKSYLIQTQMPGEVVSTNGYIDSDGNIVWEVDGDVILCSDYSMYAESVTGNTWAWLVSAGFVIFVVAGLLFRKNKRVAS